MSQILDGKTPKNNVEEATSATAHLRNQIIISKLKCCMLCIFEMEVHLVSNKEIHPTICPGYCLNTFCYGEMKYGICTHSLEMLNTVRFDTLINL